MIFHHRLSRFLAIEPIGALPKATNRAATVISNDLKRKSKTTSYN
jgi:hypothetical protein